MQLKVRETTEPRDRFPQLMQLGGIYGRNHYMRPLFDEGEGAGEGGEGDGDGDGEGGGGEAQAAWEAKDENALIRIPGIDKPVKIADLKAAHSLRSQHEGSLKIMGEIAKALRAQHAGQPKPKAQPQPRREENTDPFSELETMDILDGKGLAAVLRKLNETGIAPVHKLLPALAKEIKELKQHVTGFRQDKAEQGFGGTISQVVGSLKLPKVGGKDIEGADVLNELARDFFFSYEDEDQAKLTPETFSKMFGDRFKSMRTFFRNYEKAELEAAKERGRRRIFARPGASASANGKPVKRLSNRDVASILFEGESAET